MTHKAQMKLIGSYSQNWHLIILSHICIMLPDDFAGIPSPRCTLCHWDSCFQPTTNSNVPLGSRAAKMSGISSREIIVISWLFWGALGTLKLATGFFSSKPTSSDDAQRYIERVNIVTLREAFMGCWDRIQTRTCLP